MADNYADVRVHLLRLKADLDGSLINQEQFGRLLRASALESAIPAIPESEPASADRANDALPP